MDISRLKRNGAAVRASLVVLPDKTVVTKTGCVIHIPESFRSKQLLSMGEDIALVGYFAIILDSGEYAVNTVPALFKSSPIETTTVEINGKSYYQLRFAKGGVVFKSTDLVVDDILLYYLFEEIIARGRIPWYYGYEDMGKFFTQHGKYANRVLVATPSIGEMFTAQITRLSNDKTKPLREVLKDKRELLTIDYEYIPLRNVEFGASDTVSKVVGNYAAEGLDSAIVNPTETVQLPESLLRA